MGRNRLISKQPKRHLNRRERDEEPKPKMRPAVLAASSRKRHDLVRSAGALERLWAEVKNLREQVRKAEGKHLH